MSSGTSFLGGQGRLLTPISYELDASMQVVLVPAAISSNQIAKNGQSITGIGLKPFPK